MKKTMSRKRRATKKKRTRVRGGTTPSSPPALERTTRDVSTVLNPGGRERGRQSTRSDEIPVRENDYSHFDEGDFREPTRAYQQGFDDGYAQCKSEHA